MGLTSILEWNFLSVHETLVQRAPEGCERSSSYFHCLDQEKRGAVKMKMVGSGVHGEGSEGKEVSQQRLFSPFPYCLLGASLGKPEKPLPVQLNAGGSGEEKGQSLLKLKEFAKANLDDQFRN